jgi:cell wall assembly regulator SMI1
MSVTSISNAIKTWLQRNSNDYPGVYQTIQEPASIEEITECEVSIGFPLPEVLCDVLKVFNGQSYSKSIIEFPCSPWSRFLSCKDIALRYHSLEHICELCSTEFNTECIWDCQIAENHRINTPNAPILGHNTLWLPFAESYSGGGGPPTTWLIDLAPPVGVKTGRVIAFGGEGDALSIWAPSLHDLLEDVLKCMRRRSPEPEENIPQSLLPLPLPLLPVEQRHRKILFDDGPRIWHQYLE